jgi:Sulfotransferase family/Wzt C-terminal domain
MTARTDPVFVCACPRSGTTALNRALTRHPHLKAPKDVDKESWFFVEFFGGRTWFLNRRFSIDEDFEKEAVLFINDFMSRRCSGSEGRYLTSHPNNIFHIRPILKHLPDAKFILVSRHPQETVWSMAQHPTAVMAGWRIPGTKITDPVTDDEVRHNTEAWKRYATVMIEAIDGVFGDNVLVVYHQELILHPDSTMRRILEFTGESFLPEISSEISGTLHHSSFERDRKAVKGHLVDHFEEKRKDIAQQRHFCELVVEVAGTEMERLGYVSLAVDTPSDASEATVEPPMPSRAGNLDKPLAQVIETDITNKAGRSVPHFWLYDPMTLRIRIRANRDAENLCVCYVVKDEHGYNLFGTTTFDEDTPIPPLAEGEEIDVLFRFRQPLSNGIHKVAVIVNTVSFRDYSDNVMVQFQDDAVRFVARTPPSRRVHYAFNHPTLTRVLKARKPPVNHRLDRILNELAWFGESVRMFFRNCFEKK